MSTQTVAPTPTAQPLGVTGNDTTRRVTTQTPHEMKAAGTRIAMLTAYDYTSARLLDAAGADVLLVGDSASNVMAGHETTANTLAWAWFLVSQAPEVEARLHAELDAVLGEDPPTLRDVARLPYTRAVIDETLRLYPPVPILAREALEAEWDEANPDRPGPSDARHAWIAREMADYHRSLRARLVLLVLVLPFLAIMAIVYMVNYAH